MFVLEGLLFLGIVIASAQCNNTITTTTAGFKKENGNNTNKMGVVALSNAASETGITVPTNVSSVTPSNDSKIINIGKIVPFGNRRIIVTINSPSALRQSIKKKKKKKNKKNSDPTSAKVESLLYEEYNSDGSKLVEFMMYTMEDVSKFFGAYLHTEICHVRCEPRPEDLAREEAQKKEGATT